MDLNHILLIVALILIVVDIFFASDIPTIIATIIVAFVIAKELPVPFLYKILLGLIIWFILVAIYYWFWKKIVAKVLNHYIAPEKLKSGQEALVGRTGTIKAIEGRILLQIDDELHPFKSEKEWKDGEKAVISGFKDGVLII